MHWLIKALGGHTAGEFAAMRRSRDAFQELAMVARTRAVTRLEDELWSCQRERDYHAEARGRVLEALFQTTDADDARRRWHDLM